MFLFGFFNVPLALLLRLSRKGAGGEEEEHGKNLEEEEEDGWIACLATALFFCEILIGRGRVGEGKIFPAPQQAEKDREHVTKYFFFHESK